MKSSFLQKFSKLFSGSNKKSSEKNPEEKPAAKQRTPEPKKRPEKSAKGAAETKTSEPNRSRPPSTRNQPDPRRSTQKRPSRQERSKPPAPQRSEKRGALSAGPEGQPPIDPFEEALDENWQDRTFETLGLSQPLLDAIDELKWEKPSEVQARSLKLVFEGRDVVVQSQTGTGKTGAFALPILERMENWSADDKALVLTPTRELAQQVCEEIGKLAKHRPTTAVAIYGGASIEKQIRAVQKGIHIVVATPGRLLDLVERRIIRLSWFRIVILDEADRMLDMGFLPDIRRIFRQLPRHNRQTMLFSATLPFAIVNIAQEYQRDPLKIVVRPDMLSVEEIDHRMIKLETFRPMITERADKLLEIVEAEQPPLCMVFCEQKFEAPYVEKRLLDAGYPAACLHGDLSQRMRDRALQRFRSRHVNLLVCTDVAARGIDIQGVTHIINLSLPNASDDYIHRTGRTARAGARGRAITILTPEDGRDWPTVVRNGGFTWEPWDAAELTDNPPPSIKRDKPISEEQLDFEYRVDGIMNNVLDHTVDEKWLEAARQLLERGGDATLLIGALLRKALEAQIDAERARDTTPPPRYDNAREGGSRPSRGGPRGRGPSRGGPRGGGQRGGGPRRDGPRRDGDSGGQASEGGGPNRRRRRPPRGRSGSGEGGGGRTSGDSGGGGKDA